MGNDDLAGAERIGLGRTAEVFAWGPGRVLKLFHGWVPAGWAEHERWLTEAVHAAGLPAPAVFEPVALEGRHGFVMERVEGPSLLRVLLERPWRAAAVARQLAEVQAAVHAHRVPALPPLEGKLREAIGRASLPAQVQEQALAALAALPQGDATCHGDIHPDNVVLTARGPVVLDWTAAGRGHPLVDVVRTSLMLRLGVPPQGAVRLLVGVLRPWVHGSYLRHALVLAGATRAELQPFLLPVAAARVADQIEDELPALRAHLERLAG